MTKLRSYNNKSNGHMVRKNVCIYILKLQLFNIDDLKVFIYTKPSHYLNIPRFSRMLSTRKRTKKMLTV